MSFWPVLQPEVLTNDLDSFKDQSIVREAFAFNPAGLGTKTANRHHAGTACA